MPKNKFPVFLPMCLLPLIVGCIPANTLASNISGVKYNGHTSHLQASLLLSADKLAATFIYVLSGSAILS